MFTGKFFTYYVRYYTYNNRLKRKSLYIKYLHNKYECLLGKAEKIAKL